SLRNRDLYFLCPRRRRAPGNLQRVSAGLSGAGPMSSSSPRDYTTALPPAPAVAAPPEPRADTAYPPETCAGTQALPPASPPPVGPGMRAQYRIVKLLGGGGMGLVYQAEDTRLNRPVALKVMHTALTAQPAARERFLREARAVAAVRNDHVVTIY